MKRLILVIIVILTLLPLFSPGLFDVHDPTSVIRFFTLRATLLDGQLPAAWTNLLNHNYGYPLFLYYAPVFSYLGALISFLTPSYIIALKLTLIILTLFGAWGMYKLVGILGSVAYTLLPYHALSVYVRGSYAEFTTMMLLPWLLYYWRKPLVKETFVKTTLLTVLFFLSHNSIPFLFLPALLIWIIYYQRQNIRTTIICLLTSLAISSWFLYPVFFERNLVQVDAIATTTSLQSHALNLSQLWHSPWGYGGSSAETDGMSFMLGKFQLVLAAFALLYYIFKRHFSFQTLFFIALLLIYSFACLVWSLPIWQLFPSLSIVQFSWRSLAFASFGLAALLPRKVPTLLIIILSSLLLFFNLKFFTPLSYTQVTDADLLSQEKLDTVARDKIPEYLPASMPIFPSTSARETSLFKSATTLYGQYVHSSNGSLEFPVAYMPQWQLEVNNFMVTIAPTKEGSIVTTNNFPSGEYYVHLSWHRTTGEQISILFSLLGVIFMIGYSREHIFKRH